MRVKTHIETSPLHIIFANGTSNQTVRIEWQLGIAVQKQKQVAERLLSASILLRCATAWCMDNVIGAARSNLSGAIGATAIYHENFSAALTQRLQCNQRHSDAPSLIEHGDDDRELQPANRL